MSRVAQFLFAVGFLAIGFTRFAEAAIVTYTATHLAGTSWQYEYSVANDSAVTPIYEFTIYFAPDLYAGLGLVSSPADWDPLVIQPDIGIPADGFLDALATGSGIAQGDTVGGFTVSFTYLGQGTPGAQPFDIVDPELFETLASGRTALASTVPVSSSASLLILGGITVVAALRCRGSKRGLRRSASRDLAAA